MLRGYHGAFCLLLCGAFWTTGARQAVPQTSPAQSTPEATESRTAAALDAILDAPELQGDFVGVCVMRVRDNQVLYTRNADRVFLPASNNKLLTSFAALETLPPDFAYHTQVRALGTPDRNGILRGDLILVGGGDPILTLAELDALAQGVANAGVSEARGKLLYDDSRYDRQGLGDGWTWDDEAAAYSAQISALNVNANCVAVQVLPGKKPGDRVRVQITPSLKNIIVENTAVTGEVKQASTLIIDRARGRNAIVVTGTLPLNATPQTQKAVDVTVEDPAQFTTGLFRAALRKAGVRCGGSGKSESRIAADKPNFDMLAETTLIAEHISPSLPELLRRMNKPSDNLMAECLLKAVGAYGAFPANGIETIGTPGLPRVGTSGGGGTGAQLARKAFTAAGMNLNTVRQVDGSGLSRGNYVSPRNLARLLVYAHSRPYFPAFYASLPVAGVDGTLRNRMKNTPAQNNCHAKTGSLSHVSTLSGYVTKPSGEELAFSILINNHLGAARICTLAQDKIVQFLAGAGAKSGSDVSVRTLQGSVQCDLDVLSAVAQRTKVLRYGHSAKCPCMLHSWEKYSQALSSDRARKCPRDGDLVPKIARRRAVLVSSHSILGALLSFLIGKPAASRMSKVDQANTEPARINPMSVSETFASSTPDVWVGLDIAKATFEAALLRPAGKMLLKSFANDPAGFAKMLRWLAELACGCTPHFCMEATGSYYLACAFFLAEADALVSVVNPARIKYAGVAYGQANKTDKADARTLAQFCRKEQPALWQAATPEVRLLVALLRRLASLQAQHVAEQNRLQDPGLLDVVRVSVQASLDFLSAEMQRLQEQINQHIDQHPRLRADKKLLLSIPGVGETTAHWLLAELPDVAQFDNAQDAAAFAGLNPREYSSGTSVKKKTRLSKKGNVYLRKCLYMPALTAARFNPCIAALCQRLRERGLAKKAIIGAAMRKLLMLAYGVLRSQQEFDKDWHTNTQKKVVAAS